MTNPDRTAERDSCLCEAYGCPLLGARSTSTTGGGFLCHVHFSLDPAQMQQATVEINRLGWLASAARDLRMRSHNPRWRDTYARIKHDIVLAQRSDLQIRQNEGAERWMIRLEVELANLVKSSFPEAQTQQPFEEMTATA